MSMSAMNVFLTISLFITTTGITKGLQMVTLWEPLPALVYRSENDCVWRIKIGNDYFPAPEGATGHRLPLQDSYRNVECTVNGSQLLDVIILVTDSVPAPENVTLDTGNRILHWNPILQPSDLPPDFELVHDYNITYLVHMYDKDDVDTATSVNVPVDRHYLDLDDESIDINICEEQEFVVQAVVNNSHSENSSAVSGIFTDVPAFKSFSARLQLLIVENVFAIQVTFELKQEQCVGMFTIILHGLGSFTFDVNDTHIENGAANFALPMNVSDPMNLTICTLRVEVYGGNDVGNSTAADIQLPDHCPTMTPTYSSTIAATTRPPVVVSSPTSTSPTDPLASGFSSTIIVAVVGVLVVAIIMAIMAIIAVMIITVNRKRKAVACKPQLIQYQNVTLEKGTTLAEKPKIDINVNSNYVEVRPLSVPNEMPAMDISKTIYATVDHKKTKELHQQHLEETASAPEPESSKVQEVSVDPKEVGLSRQLHLEPLLAVLAPIKAKWYAIGTHLNLSENFLDETETNIETDEECLSDIMKNWLGYHNPSMEVLNYALSQIDEQPIIFNGGLKEFVVEVERMEEGKGEGGEETPPELPEKSG